MAGVKFLVKAGVIVSFLVLITAFNYVTTGQVPSLWTTGDAMAIPTDHIVAFAQRKLKEEEQVRFFYSLTCSL